MAIIIKKLKFKLDELSFLNINPFCYSVEPKKQFKAVSSDKLRPNLLITEKKREFGVKMWPY